MRCVRKLAPEWEFQDICSNINNWWQLFDVNWNDWIPRKCFLQVLWVISQIFMEYGLQQNRISSNSGYPYNNKYNSFLHDSIHCLDTITLLFHDFCCKLMSWGISCPEHHPFTHSVWDRSGFWLRLVFLEFLFFI